MSIQTLVLSVSVGFMMAGCATRQLERTSKDAIETFTFFDLPKVEGTNLMLGGFSGLVFERFSKIDGEYDFITITDRGPNYDLRKDSSTGDLRPFVNPKFAPRLVSFSLNLEKKRITRVDEIPLKRFDGSLMSGLPNVPLVDETPIDVAGHRLGYDKLGVDTEGVAKDQDDGSFWACEEYRPSILHFDKKGQLLQRWIPENTAAGSGVGQLPNWYKRRQANRGFEGVAVDGDQVAAFLQSPLVGDHELTRILVVDKKTGQPRGEFAYAFQNPEEGTALVDKIGDAVNIAPGRYLVIEQNAAMNDSGVHSVYEIDLAGATDLLPRRGAALSKSVVCSDEPSAVKEGCVVPVKKRLIADLVAMGLTGIEKMEGVTVLDAKTLALVNDNDFDVNKKSVRSNLFIVHLSEPLKLR